MACYIFGAGSYYGLRSKPDVSDYVIAADGGWRWCKPAEMRRIAVRSLEPDPGNAGVGMRS